VFGPILIARLRESAGEYRGGLHLIAVIMAVCIILPVMVRAPKAAQ